MTASDHDDWYLASDDPRAQSGFHGDAARWEAARRANGHLMECAVAWSPFPIEVYGVDFAPRLVGVARRRLPLYADRIWLGDVAVWSPPMRFDFVHARLDIGQTARIATWGRRLIVSSDGSLRQPESPKAEDVAARMRAHGLTVAGETYARSDENQVEICVAWT